MARKFLSQIDANSQRIINVADPTGAQDSATRKYVNQISQPKSLTLETPVAGDKIILWRTNKNITISSTVGVIVGGTNVVYQLRHNTDVSGAGTDTWTANKTVTSTTTGDIVTGTASDVSVASGEYVWVYIASVSGAVTQFHIDVNFTLD